MARNVQGQADGEEADYASAARLREALRRFDRRTEEIARLHRLTPQRYQLLLMIATGREGAKRATLRELAQRLQLAPSSVTELVHRAEETGLVRRELDPRRRGVLFLRVTPKGRRRLHSVWKDLGLERERLAMILAALDGEVEGP